MFGVFTTER